MDQNQLLVQRLPGLEIPVNHLGLLLPHDRDVDAPAVRDVERFLDVEGEFHTPKQT